MTGFKIETLIDIKEIEQAAKTFIKNNKRRKKSNITATAFLSFLEKSPALDSLNAELKKNILSSKNRGVTLGGGDFIVKKELKQDTKTAVEWKIFSTKDIKDSEGKLFRQGYNNKFKTRKEAISFLKKSLETASLVYLDKKLKQQQFKKVIPTPPIGKVSILVVNKAEELINVNRKKDVFRRNDFISSTQLSIILRNKMEKEMPQGSVGDKPKSNKLLTNRTFTFLDSVGVKVFYNNRVKRFSNVINKNKAGIIEYFFNPIYNVHDKTNRSPSKQIERNIRSITKILFGRQFNIVKGKVL